MQSNPRVKTRGNSHSAPSGLGFDAVFRCEISIERVFVPLLTELIELESGHISTILQLLPELIFGNHKKQKAEGLRQLSTVPIVIGSPVN
jgi:hypothetical protein